MFWPSELRPNGPASQSFSSLNWGCRLKARHTETELTFFQISSHIWPGMRYKRNFYKKAVWRPRTGWSAGVVHVTGTEIGGWRGACIPAKSATSRARTWRRTAACSRTRGSTALSAGRTSTTHSRLAAIRGAHSSSETPSDCQVYIGLPEVGVSYYNYKADIWHQKSHGNNSISKVLVVIRVYSGYVGRK